MKASFFLLALLLLASPATADKDHAPVLDPPGDHTVTMEGEQAIVDIRCPRGIGRTSVRAGKNGWPEKIILRLHLKGLEGFQLGGEKFTYSTGYGSTKGAGFLSTEKRGNEKGAKQEILPEGNSYSLKIKPISEEKPAVPLDGYFEMEIPAEFLKDNPTTFRLHWVDFYR